MHQLSPLADAILQSVREIARREGITLREAAERWKAEVHKKAEEIRQRKNSDQN